MVAFKIQVILNVLFLHGTWKLLQNLLLLLLLLAAAATAVASPFVTRQKAKFMIIFGYSS